MVLSWYEVDLMSTFKLLYYQPLAVVSIDEELFWIFPPNPVHWEPKRNNVYLYHKSPGFMKNSGHLFIIVHNIPVNMFTIGAWNKRNCNWLTTAIIITRFMFIIIFQYNHPSRARIIGLVSAEYGVISCRAIPYCLADCKRVTHFGSVMLSQGHDPD